MWSYVLFDKRSLVHSEVWFPGWDRYTDNKRQTIIWTFRLNRPSGRVRVWLPIRAQNIKQNADFLGANLSTFQLDPSVVQIFAPFSVQKFLLVFLRLEWRYKNCIFCRAFYRLAIFSVLGFVRLCRDQHN